MPSAVSFLDANASMVCVKGFVLTLFFFFFFLHACVLSRCAHSLRLTPHKEKRKNSGEMLIFIYKHDLVFHFVFCFVRNIYVQIDK